ncbi:hypothetical protein GCM10027261_04630 [Geodermatophilus arenarius]|uniref:PD-(D/E)XK nuclease superfamily protein n=1 Tax=Geodermatophilus arenarius TaxID=1137990 RepID=A0ABV9LEG3_9ACTN
MVDAPAHEALRYLIRSSGSPEVSTNNVLKALLDAHPEMRCAFLAFLGSVTGLSLDDCVVEREAYEQDPVTGKKSYRDFLVTSKGSPRCIVETKVDSALTSEDQAPRYLEQLDADGSLVLVTREPLVDALAVQVREQLGVRLSSSTGSYTGHADTRTVVVLSWSQLLNGVLDRSGRPFTELLALDAALVGVSDFVPFTASVQDVATGRMVQQVVSIARDLCDKLKTRLDEEEVRYDSLTRSRGWDTDPTVTITVLHHQFWVGYSPDYWATVPGDPRDDSAGFASASFPSPVWAGRFYTRPTRADRAVVSARRERLDALGVTRPLGIPLGAPRDAVVESLLEQAVAHVRVISEALHEDPSVMGVPTSAVSEGVEAPESDPPSE